VKRWFRNAARKVAEEKALYLKLDNRTPSALMDEIRRFLAVYEVELDTLSADLGALSSNFEASVQCADIVNKGALTKANQLRTGLIKDFSDAVSKIHNDLADCIDRWRGEISSVRASLEREATPLGIDLSAPAA
jgi:hypothetical protein